MLSCTTHLYHKVDLNHDLYCTATVVSNSCHLVDYSSTLGQLDEALENYNGYMTRSCQSLEFEWSVIRISMAGSLKRYIT